MPPRLRAISTMATSIPSSDVPLMMPATRIVGPEVCVLEKGTDRSVHCRPLRTVGRRMDWGQSGQSPFRASALVGVELLLKVGEELEGFYGTQLIDVEFADAVGQFVIDGFEELDLDRGFFGDEIFVLGEDLAGSFDDAHRQGGQAG